MNDHLARLAELGIEATEDRRYPSTRTPSSPRRSRASCVPLQGNMTARDGIREIWVALLGPHLEQLGRGSLVGEITSHTTEAHCEIGFSADGGLLVAWWNSASSEVWVRALAPVAR